jgi:hypothetical protein
MRNLSNITEVKETMYFWGESLNGELTKRVKKSSSSSNGVYEHFDFYIEKGQLYLQVITDDGCDCGGRLFNRETYKVDPQAFTSVLRQVSEYCAKVN